MELGYSHAQGQRVLRQRNLLALATLLLCALVIVLFLMASTRDREIVLNSETLTEAVAEFNRYNSRQIVIADPALGAQKLVGGFHVDQPETFARAVQTALNVPVSETDDRIIIGTAGASL